MFYLNSVPVYLYQQLIFANNFFWSCFNLTPICGGSRVFRIHPCVSSSSSLRCLNRCHWNSFNSGRSSWFVPAHISEQTRNAAASAAANEISPGAGFTQRIIRRYDVTSAVSRAPAERRAPRHIKKKLLLNWR